MEKATLEQRQHATKPEAVIAAGSGGKTDPRVDEYISGAAEFARPILRQLRALIHAGCPDAEETIKWGRPMFVQKGGILCSMAAFKAHCSFGFWHPEMSALLAREGYTGEESAGQFGRITTPADLPDDATLRRYIAEAVKLGASGKAARPRPAAGAKRMEIPVPEDFGALLKQHPAAGMAFEKFSPSHRREYLEWITEAKRDETRKKRMATAIEWLAEGKSRNWKYAGCCGL